jgi:hypothetical protein
MQPTAVVKPMEVAGNCQVSLFLGGVDRAGFLPLQCSEEAFSYSVIPAVSSPAHALREALLGQSETKFAARVLGGFNRSSQHLDRGVYGATRRMDAKIDWAGSDAFSRCTLTS